MARRFPLYFVSCFLTLLGLLGLTPQTASAANPLMYVSSFNTNSVKLVFDDGSFTTYATGSFDGPAGMVMDGAGNLFVNNRGLATTFNGTTMSKIAPGGAISLFASGFNTPIGSARDTAGNIFVANYSVGTISKVTSGGVVSTFASGLTTPHGLTIDAANNLYVTQYNSGVVTKITPAASASLYGNVGGLPLDAAFDSQGNLFVCLQSGNTGVIDKITPGGVVSTFTSFTSLPQGLLFDKNDNLYCTDALGNGTIWKILPNTTKTAFVTGFIGRTMIFVPEPASLGVLGFGVVVLFRRRRAA